MCKRRGSKLSQAHAFLCPVVLLTVSKQLFVPTNYYKTSASTSACLLLPVWDMLSTLLMTPGSASRLRW